MNLKIVSYALILMQALFFTSPSLGKETLPSRIQATLKTLGPNSSFVYYDLDPSERERNALKTLKINMTDDYNNYGNLDGLESEVRDFLKTLGKGNDTSAQDVSQLITRLVKEVLQGCGQETAWVAVRSFTPTSAYDLPRWHTDGYYYAPYEGDPYKFAITLRGPPTLFYQLPADKREEFYALQRKGNEQNEYNRQALALMLNTVKEAISIGQLYQGAVFIVGSNHAAVHSEPPIKEERLFLSSCPFFQGARSKLKNGKLNRIIVIFPGLTYEI